MIVAAILVILSGLLQTEEAESFAWGIGDLEVRSRVLAYFLQVVVVGQLSSSVHERLSVDKNRCFLFLSARFDIHYSFLVNISAALVKCAMMSPPNFHESQTYSFVRLGTHTGGTVLVSAVHAAYSVLAASLGPNLRCFETFSRDG